MSSWRSLVTVSIGALRKGRSIRPPCPTPADRREDLQIGRVYLTNTPYGDRCVWSIYLNDHVPKVPGVPISGSAATLDKATAAMLKCYGQMRAKAAAGVGHTPRLSRSRPHFPLAAAASAGGRYAGRPRRSSAVSSVIANTPGRG